MVEKKNVTVNKEDLESILDILFESVQSLESYRGLQGSTRDELLKFVSQNGLKVIGLNT